MNYDECFEKRVEVTIGKIKHRGILRKIEEVNYNDEFSDEYVGLFNGITTIWFKKNCITNIKLI